jgi:hypothetical protein
MQRRRQNGSYKKGKEYRRKTNRKKETKEERNGIKGIRDRYNEENEDKE